VPTKKALPSTFLLENLSAQQVLIKLWLGVKTFLNWGKKHPQLLKTADFCALPVNKGRINNNCLKVFTTPYWPLYSFPLQTKLLFFYRFVEPQSLFEKGAANRKTSNF